MLSTTNTSLPTTLQTLYPSQFLCFSLSFYFIFHHLLSASWLFLYISPLVRRPRNSLFGGTWCLWARRRCFFLFFFFGRSASREAMELWTVGQTFEANRWGCFGFRLNWVCVCVICVPVSFCVAPSEAWIPLCPWLMMSYPLSCKRQSVLIHALSAAPVPLESGQIL